MILIIKGDGLEAIDAAEEHGAVKVRVLASPQQHRLEPELFCSPAGGTGAVLAPIDSSILEAELQLEVAASWLSTPPNEPPFPPGALLWYKEN